MIIIKLKGPSGVILPSILDNDEYLAKDHEFYMTDCKSYLMKDNNDKEKSNGKMYVSDIKSGTNIVNKMAEKFTDTDIVKR